MSALHVICKVGESEYAVPAADVFQMDSYSGATPVPGAPSYVAGLVQVRSQVVPVIDLRIRFGLESLKPTLESRLVVMKLGQRLIGLLVDSAREVQTISQEQFKTPPGVIAVQSANFVKSVAQLKDRIIILLDSEKVIGEEVSHV
jgi:purine-binding chemotaxis protein CheW